MHMVSTFVKHVGRERDDGIRNILTRLCQLHALYRTHVNSGDFIKVNFTINLKQWNMKERPDVLKWQGNSGSTFVQGVKLIQACMQRQDSASALGGI